MKNILILLLFVTCSIRAHIDENWVILHSVNTVTHDVEHLLTTSSNNRAAIVTIDCEQKFILDEQKRRYVNHDVVQILYAIDDGVAKVAKNYTVDDAHTLVHTMTSVSRAILDSSDKLTFIVLSKNGDRDTYNFNMSGYSNSIESLVELCK